MCIKIYATLLFSDCLLLRLCAPTKSRANFQRSDCFCDSAHRSAAEQLAHYVTSLHSCKALIMHACSCSCSEIAPAVSLCEVTKHLHYPNWTSWVRLSRYPECLPSFCCLFVNVDKLFSGCRIQNWLMLYVALSIRRNCPKLLQVQLTSILLQIQLIVWWGHLEMWVCFSSIHCSFSHVTIIPSIIFCQCAVLNALRLSSSIFYIIILECFLLCVGARQDALRYVLVLWKCCIHWSLCHKTYPQQPWLRFSQRLHCLKQLNMAKHNVVHHFVAAWNLYCQFHCWQQWQDKNLTGVEPTQHWTKHCFHPNISKLEYQHLSLTASTFRHILEAKSCALSNGNKASFCECY